MKSLKIIILFFILIFTYYCTMESNNGTSSNDESNDNYKNPISNLKKLNFDNMTNAEIHNYLLDFIKTKIEEDSININISDPTNPEEVVDAIKIATEEMGNIYGFETEFPAEVLLFMKNLNGPADNVFETEAYQNIYNTLSDIPWKKALLDEISSAYYNNEPLNVPENITGIEKEAWDIVLASHQWWVVDGKGPSNEIDSWSGLCMDALGFVTSGPISAWACSIMWEMACSYIGYSPF